MGRDDSQQVCVRLAAPLPLLHRCCLKEGGCAGQLRLAATRRALAVLGTHIQQHAKVALPHAQRSQHHQHAGKAAVPVAGEGASGEAGTGGVSANHAGRLAREAGAAQVLSHQHLEPRFGVNTFLTSCKPAECAAQAGSETGARRSLAPPQPYQLHPAALSLKWGCFPQPSAPLSARPGHTRPQRSLPHSPSVPQVRKPSARFPRFLQCTQKCATDTAALVWCRKGALLSLRCRCPATRLFALLHWQVCCCIACRSRLPSQSGGSYSKGRGSSCTGEAAALRGYWNDLQEWAADFRSTEPSTMAANIAALAAGDAGAFEQLCAALMSSQNEQRSQVGSITSGAPGGLSMQHR